MQTSVDILKSALCSLLRTAKTARPKQMTLTNKFSVGPFAVRSKEVKCVL